MAALGHGRYFPWSIPSLLSGVAGRLETPVGALGVGLVVLVGATGAAGTALRWRNADHTR